ncbi:MAG: Anti-sigma-K factor rskA [Gaiellales bacterium]|jgi:hypothetical protein|nr:Anti-sigma-K factor rskA [Gaiellales bacterium]MDX6591308.1 Anti-sigma-K factor rskA [Gaiellales bacterium]
MTNNPMPTEIEDRLRDAGAPAEPPVHLRALARDAALGGPPVVMHTRTIHPRGRFGRFALAAAVLVASAAAALVIGVGGNNPTVIRTISMTGNAPGTGASVDFLKSDGPTRQVVVKIWGLDPAPKGAYYQVWMDPGDGVPTTALVAVNTKPDGTVEAHTTMPTGIGWEKCWVTLENAPSDGAVLRS